MKAVQFLNRVCRQLERPDFRELSLSDQQIVIDCANKALTDYHLAIPEHLKSGKEGVTLAAPISVDYLVTPPTNLPEEIAGRSVYLTSDPILNQYRNDYDTTAEAGGDLIFPALAGTGTTRTLYGDVARLKSRIKSVRNVRDMTNSIQLRPWGESGGITPWGYEMQANSLGKPQYYRIESVHPSARKDNAEDSVYSTDDLAMLLRVYPIPDALTRITFDVEYAPFTIDISDTLPALPARTGSIASTAFTVMNASSASLLMVVQGVSSTVVFSQTGGHTKTEMATVIANSINTSFAAYMVAEADGEDLVITNLQHGYTPPVMLYNWGTVTLSYGTDDFTPAAPIDLPVLPDFIQEVVTLAEEELSYFGIFKGDPSRAQAAAVKARERLNREPDRPDTGAVTIRRTPRNW